MNWDKTTTCIVLICLHLHVFPLQARAQELPFFDTDQSGLENKTSKVESSPTKFFEDNLLKTPVIQGVEVANTRRPSRANLSSQNVLENKRKRFGLVTPSMTSADIDEASQVLLSGERAGETVQPNAEETALPTQPEQQIIEAPIEEAAPGDNEHASDDFTENNSKAQAPNADYLQSLIEQVKVDTDPSPTPTASSNSLADRLRKKRMLKPPGKHTF